MLNMTEKPQVVYLKNANVVLERERDDKTSDYANLHDILIHLLVCISNVTVEAGQNDEVI